MNENTAPSLRDVSGDGGFCKGEELAGEALHVGRL
jgi:hypothetical protein